MFNYHKLQKLKNDVYYLKDDIDAVQKANAVLRDRIGKFEDATVGLFVILGRFNFDFINSKEVKLQNYVNELRSEKEKKDGRLKIETIMRDLLKANVFKQVEGVDK